MTLTLIMITFKTNHPFRMANEFGSLLVGGQCFFNEQTAFALMVICVEICTTRYLHLDLKTYSFCTFVSACAVLF